MTCKYCNGKLAPLRSLTDGEFCSDEHRHAYHQEQMRARSEPLAPEHMLSAAFEAQRADAGTDSAGRIATEAPPATFDGPVSSKPPELACEADNSGPAATPLYRYVTQSWRWLLAAWKTAPSDLKALALLMPVLVALACSPAMHKVRFHFSTGHETGLRARTRQALSNQWKVFAQRISDRAAIAITDDFRSGLDFWQSRSNLTQSWSFDSNGFVQPGPLAILKPTEDLHDYDFEFLAEIQRKAIGAAFRARDLDNYYAVKFIEDDSGPLPAIRLVRYAVINGKEGPHVEKPLPSSVRADMMNRFHVAVHGGDFTIMAQGEVVDFFSDTRLKTGGVGFFCARGEKARLRWVEVSHQYDMLGKLCAFLAPVSLAGVGKD